MKSTIPTILAGVDTHSTTHTLALLDEHGRVTDTETFNADPKGYERLIAMIGDPALCLGVGVEGTNSYGAALSRRLAAAGYTVHEVLRPKRSVRRSDGKSDPIDAIAAARSVLAGDGISTPKASDGWCEALRHLIAAREQLVTSMTAISNCLAELLTTAPEGIRERYRSLPSKRRIGKLAACRPSGGIVERNVLSSLKTLASSWRELHDRADVLECRMRQILEENARPLLDVYCMGTMSAAQLAVIGGDNPERIRSEAAFAKLCGACPLPASSGKTNRHRLNRSGNRQGNRALYNVALVRMSHHQPTKDYVVRKTKEGKGKLEIMRCLKRYIAREAYRALIAIRNGEAGREPAVERGARLREVRVSLGKPSNRSATRWACRPAASARSNVGFGICPNSNDKSSSGWTQSSGKANTPTHLTMYRSIKNQATSRCFQRLHIIKLFLRSARRTS